MRGPTRSEAAGKDLSHHLLLYAARFAPHLRKAHAAAGGRAAG